MDNKDNIKKEGGQKKKKEEMYGQKVVRRSSLPNPKTPNTHGVIPGPDRPAIGREITRPSPWETIVISLLVTD